MKDINCQNSRKGLTLVESLISIIIVGALLITVLGAFYISKVSTIRARHRMVAMNAIKGYMEREVESGYLGGYVDGDFYVTASSADPVPFTIDNRGTSDASDDLVGTIKPYPYPAAIASVGTVSFKTIGFVAEWAEDTFSSGPALTCNERAITYVAEHS